VLTISNAASSTQTTYSIITQPAPDNSSRATIGIFTFPFYKPVASFLPVSLPYHFYNTCLDVADPPWSGTGQHVTDVSFDGDRYFDTLLTIVRVPAWLRKYVRIGASATSLSLLGLNLILSLEYWPIDEVEMTFRPRRLSDVALAPILTYFLSQPALDYS